MIQINQIYYFLVIYHIDQEAYSSAHVQNVIYN